MLFQVYKAIFGDRQPFLCGQQLFHDQHLIMQNLCEQLSIPEDSVARNNFRDLLVLYLQCQD